MNKRIVLFSDGTANSSVKAEKTNVWRLFQALDQTAPGQLAYYHDGVGTSPNRYLALIGCTFGWGLKRNVIDLYKFVCRNYEPGVEISGFGFSRGAFTIRVLVGLIANEGLVTFRSEEELNRNARAAYRNYRSKRFPSWSPIVRGIRWARDMLMWTWDRVRGFPTYSQLAETTRNNGRIDIPIHFLGLWDTVSAYGMPILELKHGINWLLWPMMFGDLKLSPLVRRACHALSLDDERATFHPLLWDESGEAQLAAEGKVYPGRITQVWFAGVHSNVGGGYPEDQLSLVSLHWMMSQADANGIKLLPAAVNGVAHAKSPYARLYNSRAGFAAYYRYSPRQIPVCKDLSNMIIRPIIHGSVIMRMANGSDLYAPISLRREFWVLAPDGKLMPMEGGPGAMPVNSKPLAAPAPLMALSDPEIAARKTALQKAISKLDRPDTDAVGLVWDTVWWRRVAYFCTLGLTALLVAFPAIGARLTMLLLKLANVLPVGSDMAWVGDLSNGPVSSAVTIAAGFMPSYSHIWTEAFARNPHAFVLLLAILLLGLYLGRALKTRIRDRARFAWHKDLKPDYLDWLLRSERGSRNGMAVAACGALVLSAASFIGDWNALAKLEIGALLVVLALLLVWRTARISKLQAKLRSQLSPTNLPSTFALSVARKLRTNPVLAGFYSWMAGKLVPLLFALGLLAVGLLIANRVLFDAVSSTGYFCRSSIASEAGKDDGARFSTDQICWASGFLLDEGVRYRITLKTPGDWFDRASRADVGGVPTTSFAHSAGSLMKRWWREKWFQPIARIGNSGNDEYVLVPIAPLKPHAYHEEPKIDGGRFAKIFGSEAERLMNSDPTPDDRKTLVAEITAKTTGELFLYVNDAVLMWPGSMDKFYRNNSGTGILTVERIMPDGQRAVVCRKSGCRS